MYYKAEGLHDSTVIHLERSPYRNSVCLLTTLIGSKVNRRVVHKNIVKTKTATVTEPRDRKLNVDYWIIDHLNPFNDLITDHLNDLLCLPETWLQQDEYVSLNEATPLLILILTQLEAQAEGRGAAIFHSRLLISPKTKLSHNSSESLILSQPCWKVQRTV